MTNAARVYQALKHKAITFDFRPGDRLNEVELAAELQTSRTPLREALNRLSAEGFVSLSDKPGFYWRQLNAEEVFDLYEARLAIETAGARLAAQRASDEDLRALLDMVARPESEITAASTEELLARDEIFHMRIADISGNREFGRLLANIHERIYFVRAVARDQRRASVEAEHREIAQALVDRDGDKAVKLMIAHIEQRLDQIVDVIKESISRIYMRTS